MDNAALKIKKEEGLTKYQVLNRNRSQEIDWEFSLYNYKLHPRNIVFVRYYPKKDVQFYSQQRHFSKSLLFLNR